MVFTQKMGEWGSQCKQLELMENITAWSASNFCSVLCILFRTFGQEQHHISFERDSSEGFFLLVVLKRALFRSDKGQMLGRDMFPGYPRLLRPDENDKQTD